MTAERESPGLLSLAVDRILDAPPATVFRALTDPALYARWMGPEGSETTVEEMDAIDGGRFAIRVRLPGGPEVGISGTYLTVDPPSRLEHTWVVEGDATVTNVAFRLHPYEDGTRLVLTHTGFADPADVGRNDAGWRHQLDRLERLLAS